MNNVYDVNVQARERGCDNVMDFNYTIVGNGSIAAVERKAKRHYTKMRKSREKECYCIVRCHVTKVELQATIDSF